MRNKAIFIIPIMLVMILAVFGACVSYQLPADIDLISGVPDFDKDGLSDQQEKLLMTDPKKPDTDGDGLLDGAEVKLQLDPLNPDTERDGVNDAEDVWPRLNNNSLYLYSTMSITIIALILFPIIQLKFGFTKKRKQIIKQIREKQAEEDALFRQVRGRIEKLAKQKFGSLVLADVATELEIDPKLLEKFFFRLKARKEGQLYRFSDIEKSFRKNEKR